MQRTGSFSYEKGEGEFDLGHSTVLPTGPASDRSSVGTSTDETVGFNGTDVDADGEHVQEVEDQHLNSKTSNGRASTDRFGFIAASDTRNSLSVVQLSVLRRRELKWVYMLNNWPEFMNRKFVKVRDRCRKGIPRAMRHRAWKYLCGADFEMKANTSPMDFHELSSLPNDSWSEDIKKDLHRQFPNHELFNSESYGKNGQEDLFKLLKAWATAHPEEGYCQGQAPIAATLLMHMPVEDAFFCFSQICTTYLPGYYSPGLEAIQLDGDVLFGLLKKFCPSSYKHLKKHSVDPALYMIEWFMCIYCRTLPWPTVLRIWDMFLCEGVKVLFKVAITLFRFALSSPKDLRCCTSMYDTVNRLRNLPEEAVKEDVLIEKIVQLNLREEDLEKVHYKKLKERKLKAKEL